jgi:hypothetical protein
MRTFKLVLVTVLALLITASLGMAAGAGFKATLSGKEVMPMAVDTKTTGDATFVLGKDGKEIEYVLNIKNIENVTAAHIHAGKKGVEGPPVAGLFGGPKKDGKFSGVLGKGTIADKDLKGPLAGKTLADLIKMIKDGEAYVNVHTPAHPGGEIRGQIE